MSVSIACIIGSVVLLGALIVPTIVGNYKERKKTVKIKVSTDGRDEQEWDYD